LCYVCLTLHVFGALMHVLDHVRIFEDGVFLMCCCKVNIVRRVIPIPLSTPLVDQQMDKPNKMNMDACN
jgi:hypothetical protein